MSAQPRYHAVAMVLHWAIASLILVNIGLGVWMHEAIEVAETQSLATAGYQLHKSLGLTVLVLTLVRLGWRLGVPPPPLPAGMTAWERWAARSTHILFYGLMLALPLSGWLYVSTQWRGAVPLTIPTLWFGLFEVPHLFGLDQLEHSVRAVWADRFLLTHEWLVWSMLALLALHVGAALKHQFVSHDQLLRRMWPQRRWQAMAGTLSLLLLLGAGIGLSLWQPAPPLLGQTQRIESSADGWQIDPTRSHIRFAGVHAGTPFNGQFERWAADLRLQPDDPARSTLTAQIWTGSARDGVTLHEETLPKREWFDVASHPTSRFSSTRIEPLPGGDWAVYGELQIKDQRLQVGPLQLRFAAGEAHISGDLRLDRADANMGMESDPDGDWVSREIAVTLAVSAAPR